MQIIRITLYKDYYNKDYLQSYYKDCHHYGYKQRINPNIVKGKTTLVFYGTKTQTHIKT